MKRILFLITTVIVLTACNSGTSQKKETTTASGPADVTEVLYFHGKQRCVTCNAIEKLTTEVVDSLANEKVILKIIDISKKENEAIADKYEVTWSSLILDRNGKTENLTEMGFGYAKAQPGEFKARLAEAIAQIAR